MADETVISKEVIKRVSRLQDERSALQGLDHSDRTRRDGLYLGEASPRTYCRLFRRGHSTPSMIWKRRIMRLWRLDTLVSPPGCSPDSFAWALLGRMCRLDSKPADPLAKAEAALLRKDERRRPPATEQRTIGADAYMGTTCVKIRRRLVRRSNRRSLLGSER
jgi:hypothetical protein